MLTALFPRRPATAPQSGGRDRVCGKEAVTLAAEDIAALATQIVEGVKVMLPGTMQLSLEQVLRDHEQRLLRLLEVRLVEHRRSAPDASVSSASSLLAPEPMRVSQCSDGHIKWTAQNSQAMDQKRHKQSSKNNSNPERAAHRHDARRFSICNSESLWRPWHHWSAESVKTLPSGLKALEDVRDRELLEDVWGVGGTAASRPVVTHHQGTVVETHSWTCPTIMGLPERLQNSNSIPPRGCTVPVSSGAQELRKTHSGDSAVSGQSSRTQQQQEAGSSKARRIDPPPSPPLPLPAAPPAPAGSAAELLDVVGCHQQLRRERNPHSNESLGSKGGSASERPLVDDWSARRAVALPLSVSNTAALPPPSQMDSLGPNQPGEPSTTDRAAATVAECHPCRGNLDCRSWEALVPSVQHPEAECGGATKVTAVPSAATASSRPGDAPGTASRPAEPVAAAAKGCTHGVLPVHGQGERVAEPLMQSTWQQDVQPSMQCSEAEHGGAADMTFTASAASASASASASAYEVLPRRTWPTSGSKREGICAEAEMVVSTSAHQDPTTFNRVATADSAHPSSLSRCFSPASSRLTVLQRQTFANIIGSRAFHSDSQVVRLNREDELLNEFVSDRVDTKAPSPGHDDSAFFSSAFSDPSHYSEPKAVNTVQRVGSPLLLRLCGILPWGCNGVPYRYGVLLLAAGLVAVFVEQYLHAQRRIVSTTHCPLGVCMAFSSLSDLVLVVGTFLGLLAMRKLTSLKLLGSPTAMLARFAIQNDVVKKWSSATSWQLFYLSVLWVASLAFRAASMPSDPSSQDVVRACAFMLTSLFFMGLVFGILHVSCLICIVIDSYVVSVRVAMDLTSGIQKWDKLQALLRRVSRALDKGFLLVQTTAMAVQLCSITDLILQESQPISWFLSNMLLAQSLILLLSKAAEVTEMCTRVPSLINSLEFEGGECSPQRHYLVEHITYSAAGFYVGEVRLTASMALKLTHISILAVFGVLTKLSTA